MASTELFVARKIRLKEQKTGKKENKKKDRASSSVCVKIVLSVTRLAPNGILRYRARYLLQLHM